METLQKVGWGREEREEKPRTDDWLVSRDSREPGRSPVVVAFGNRRNTGEQKHRLFWVAEVAVLV